MKTQIALILGVFLFSAVFIGLGSCEEDDDDDTAEDTAEEYDDTEEETDDRDGKALLNTDEDVTEEDDNTEEDDTAENDLTDEEVWQKSKGSLF